MGILAQTISAQAILDQAIKQKPAPLLLEASGLGTMDLRLLLVGVSVATGSLRGGLQTGTATPSNAETSTVATPITTPLETTATSTSAAASPVTLRPGASASTSAMPYATATLPMADIWGLPVVENATNLATRGADKETCSCTHPGDDGGGRNGYSCTDGSSGYCASNEVCYATEPFARGSWGDGCHDPGVRPIPAQCDRLCRPLFVGQSKSSPANNERACIQYCIDGASLSAEKRCLHCANRAIPKRGYNSACQKYVGMIANNGTPNEDWNLECCGKGALAPYHDKQAKGPGDIGCK